jgi:hypothetical protein
LRDWARAKHFVREALQQAPPVPDGFEPTAEGICGGDCKSRLIPSSHLKTTCLLEDKPRLCRCALFLAFDVQPQPKHDPEKRECNMFVREALAFPNQFEPATAGICGDRKSRMIWRLSLPNFLKPLEDHVNVSTRSQSQLMSLCTLPGIKCPATAQA